MTEPLVCPDCDVQLARAFPSSNDYARCSRCGHVFNIDILLERRAK